jgi:hypothetical protein
VAVVEPGFGTRGFGYPDAAFRLRFADGTRVVIFLEAKLGSYLEACWLPQARGHKKFNSRLNGQLELNHRLAVALTHYHPQHPGLIEPEWILQTAYGNTYPGRVLRHVNRPVVLQKLVHDLAQAKMYLHMIVTADNDNPLQDPASRGFLPEIFLNEQDGNQWDQQHHRFGWTNWAKLKALAGRWNDPPARFPDNFAFNFPLLLHHGAPDADEPPAGEVQGVPPGWPPGRPPTGVSLIYAPAINTNTLVHFSWRYNSCRLRDYTLNQPPQANDALDTMAVFRLIMREQTVGHPRPGVDKAAAWQAIIQAVNHQHHVNAPA